MLACLAMFSSGCSKKGQDYEAAKAAVAQELVSADTSHFCPINEAFFSTKDGNRSVKLWVDTENRLGAHVRTHFEVTLDPKTGTVKGATCLECAAEDEKQGLNEAVDELQKLNSPSK